MRSASAPCPVSEAGGAAAVAGVKPAGRGADLLLAALACVGLALAFYGPAVRGYLVGDDISFVRHNPHWLGEALRPIGPWHYYPVTSMMFSLLGMLTDRQPGPLHLLSILVHAAIGVGLFAWLGRFGIARWVRLVAALVFVSRGIAYEAVIWITELSYLVVTALTLLVLAAWDRHLRGGGRRDLAVAAAGYAIALLTMEHALLLPLIVVLYDWVVRPAATAGPAATFRSRLTVPSLWRDARRYAPFVLVTLGFLLLKQTQHVALLQATATPGAAAAPVPSGWDVTTRLAADRSWFGSFNTPWRAYLDLLLGTTVLFLPAVTLVGGDHTWLTLHPWLALLPWLAVHLWILWRGRPLTRFLLLWAYVYLAPLAIASVPQARYYYMAPPPASALIGLGAEAIARRLRPRMPRAAIGALLGVALAALIVGEGVFVRARVGEWRHASDLVRRAVEDLQRDVSPSMNTLVLV